MSVKYLRCTYFHLGASREPNPNPVATCLKAGDKYKEDWARPMEGQGDAGGFLLQVVTIGITSSDPLEIRSNSPEDMESNVKHFGKWAPPQMKHLGFYVQWFAQRFF